MPLRLVVERLGGQWLITSPDLPGLYVAHADRATALASVDEAVNALQRVRELLGDKSQNVTAPVAA